MRAVFELHELFYDLTRRNGQQKLQAHTPNQDGVRRLGKGPLILMEITFTHYTLLHLQPWLT